MWTKSASLVQLLNHGSCMHYIHCVKHIARLGLFSKKGIGGFEELGEEWSDTR